MKVKKFVGLFLVGVMTFSSAGISLSYAQEPDPYENGLTVSAPDEAVSSAALEAEAKTDIDDDTNLQLDSVIKSNDLWTYSVNTDGIYIHKYLGTEEEVSIPNEIDGMPVVQLGIYTSYSGSHNNIFENIAIKRVIVPNTVKTIYFEAFADSETLKEIVLSDGLKTIDDCAFRGCKALTSIVIPSTVSSYGEEVFQNCISLTDVTINSGASISKNMFNGCTSLENCIINKSVSVIGSHAFSGCSALKSFNFPEDLTTIEDSAFSDSGLKSITLPSTVKTIGGYAFNNCSALTSANLNDAITKIGASAFGNCKSLNTVNIPKSLTKIENITFEGCSAIKEIVMGENITVIGESSFQDCTSLNKLTLNEGLTTIENRAFNNCKSLESLKLPSTVVEIENGGWDMWAEAYIGVFSNCTSLSNIELNEGLATLGAGAFYKCPVKTITIPSTVTTMGKGVFIQCDKLTDITIKGQIKTINDEMFKYCYMLNSINIPDSVNSIGDYAFSDCKSLKSIEMGKNVVSIGNFAFTGCTGLLDIKLNDGLQSINQQAFKDVPAESIIIPGTVMQIDNEVFYDTGILKAIFLGKQPNSFGNDVFYNRNHPDVTIFYADSTGWSEGTYNGYKCYPYPAVNEEISIDDCDRQGFLINISGTDVAYTNGTVSVWSDKDGKDDLEEFTVNIEYDPQKNISYVPEINLDTAKHNDETGLYNVEFCYGTENRKTDVVKSVKVDVPTVSNKTEIELPDVSVTTGGTVRVPVRITNNIGFSTFTFILNYDSSILTAVSAEKGSLWEGSMVMNPKFAPNQVSLNGMDIANNLKTGDLCYVDFKVNDNVQENIKTEISVEVRELYQLDDKYKSVPIRSLVKNSNVDIQHIVSGDVDFDGNVTALDATQALLHSASVNTLEGTALEAADYNGDGVVTAYDATLILLRAANLDQ